MKDEPIEYLILKAARFAADRHRIQRRKDAEASPYINHPIAVAETLAAAGVTDRTTLLAAILHDVIEDTETKPSEIEEIFGDEVCRVIEEVSDDKSLPKARRKTLQVEHAPHLSDRAKLLKLGDLTVNVADVVNNPPVGWSLARRIEYLDWARRVTDGCGGVNEVLEQNFRDLVEAGLHQLNGGIDSDRLPRRVEALPPADLSMIGSLDARGRIIADLMRCSIRGNSAAHMVMRFGVSDLEDAIEGATHLASILFEETAVEYLSLVPNARPHPDDATVVITLTSEVTGEEHEFEFRIPEEFQPNSDMVDGQEFYRF